MSKDQTKEKLVLSEEIDFAELVKLRPEDEQENSQIKFYCKDCQKIVTVKKHDKKLKFKCDLCKGDNVAFGTEKSLINYYHIK